VTRLERRWARALLESFAPVGGPGLAPREGEVEYLRALDDTLRRVRPTAAWGLRIAVWLAALAPIWAWGRFGTVLSLARERRAALLGELLRHRSFAVRELVLLLKFVACVALLGTESVRTRSRYDDAQAQAAAESGLYRTLAPEARRVRLRVWEGDPSPAVPIDEEREAS
jgi:hypothetical protein